MFMDSDDCVIDEMYRSNELFDRVYVPNFGLYQLSIRQAAELISKDMWYSGEILDVDEPEGWDDSEDAPDLIKALAEYVRTYEDKLICALELGRLSSSAINRNLDEKILADKTYIEFDKLCEWLEQRGYEIGDIINGWAFDEADISLSVENEVRYLRAVIKKNQSLPKIDDDFQTMYKKVVLDNKLLIDENQRLRKQVSDLQSPQEKLNNPVSAKARKSFLLIIEALCKRNQLNSQDRGMAGKIKSFVELQTKKTIDEGTVKNILDQIPCALD